MKTLLTLLLLAVGGKAWAQCTTLGQTPATAFPVCGTSVFRQDTVPACTNGPIPAAGCSGEVNLHYDDVNPYWYKFTCFQSGTLGFTIVPNNLADDYDWQLFDVTGHAVDEVYTNTDLFVAANWSGEPGTTGTSTTANSLLVCGSYTNGPYRPLFSKMPVLQKGHRYLLLVSHFTRDSQSGYSLSFGGGTAVITDTTPPAMQAVSARCDGSTLYLKLNKSMKRSSLTAAGTEFRLQPAATTVSAARVPGAGFDMDSLVLELQKPLPPGDYALVIGVGSDGNTILDNCEASIPAGDKLSFNVPLVPPTPMSAIASPGCVPDRLLVAFGGPMRCSSIAPDGSDFVISGTPALQITGAAGWHCRDGLADTMEIRLSAPAYLQGNYTVALRPGSDGNTLISDCGVATAAGATLPFSTADTVSAAFSSRFDYFCGYYTVALDHPGGHQVNQWSWDFGGSLHDQRQHLVLQDTSFAPIDALLRVSNGVCSDTAAVRLTPNRDFQLVADFDAPAFLCPEDEATFVNHSLGHILSWDWDFGNGQGSAVTDPPRQRYPVPQRSTDYTVSLVVQNQVGCRDTAVRIVKVINNCYIDVPTAFTPNGDGQNDYLYPLNAYKADNLEFRVYNRYGQLVFETRDWTRKWDGRFQGKPQDAGGYVWMLSFTDRDTGERIFRKGTTLLIR